MKRLEILIDSEHFHFSEVIFRNPGAWITPKNLDPILKEEINLNLQWLIDLGHYNYYKAAIDARLFRQIGKFGIIKSPFHQITISPNHHFIKSPSSSPNDQFTISANHPFTKSPFYQSTISPNYCFTKSLIHQITISSNRYFTKSPNHYFTSSPNHHFTKSPFHHLTRSPFH